MYPRGTPAQSKEEIHSVSELVQITCVIRLKTFYFKRVYFSSNSFVFSSSSLNQIILVFRYFDSAYTSFFKGSSIYSLCLPFVHSSTHFILSSLQEKLSGGLDAAGQAV